MRGQSVEHTQEEGAAFPLVAPSYLLEERRRFEVGGEVERNPRESHGRPLLVSLFASVSTKAAAWSLPRRFLSASVSKKAAASGLISKVGPNPSRRSQMSDLAAFLSTSVSKKESNSAKISKV